MKLSGSLLHIFWPRQGPNLNNCPTDSELLILLQTNLVGWFKVFSEGFGLFEGQGHNEGFTLWKNVCVVFSEPLSHLHANLMWQCVIARQNIMQITNCLKVMVAGRVESSHCKIVKDLALWGVLQFLLCIPALYYHPKCKRSRHALTVWCKRACTVSVM